MALTWNESGGGNITDVVNHPTVGSAGDTQISIGGWFRVTTFTANRALFELRNTANSGLAFVVRLTGTTEIQILWDTTAGTNINYVTTDLAISPGVDIFIGVSISKNAGAGAKVAVSTRLLSGGMRSCTMSAVNDGGGTLQDTGGDLLAGNRHGNNASLQGRISRLFAIVGKVLTVKEWGMLARKPWRYWDEMVLWVEYGYGGTGSQIDLSGNGNHGTISGPTAVDHAAIGHPFFVPNLFAIGVGSAPLPPAITPMDLWYDELPKRPKREVVPVT